MATSVPSKIDAKPQNKADFGESAVNLSESLVNGTSKLNDIIRLIRKGLNDILTKQNEEIQHNCKSRKQS